MPKTGTRLKSSTSPVVLALTVQEASAALRICRTKVYDAIRAGELSSYRVGKSRRIPLASVEAYQQRLVEEEQARMAGGAA